MIAAFSLVCTMMLVDPTLGIAEGNPVRATLNISSNHAAISSMPGLSDEGQMPMRRLRDGVIELRSRQNRGTRGSPDFTPLWARLSKTDKNFRLEWLMVAERAIDGRFTGAIWAEGSCSPGGLAPA